MRSKNPKRPAGDSGQGRSPRGRRPKSTGNRFEDGLREDRRNRTGEGPKRPSKPGSGNFKSKNFKRVKRKSAEELTRSSDNIRLNRFLSISGICSRREADDLIAAGLVQVNNKVVVEMGYKVKPTDSVKYNGSLIKAERKVYLLLNKPKGFLTTMDDPKARKTVMDLVGNACRERIYPVGRLDRATTGVLLFTNDGDMAKKLTHPSHGARKIYHVVLDKPMAMKDFNAIAKGLTLEDGPAPVDQLNFIDPKNKRELGIELHIGRNRIVRRIFAELGYEVEKLDRVSMAGLTKKNLSRGQWRFLDQKEVNFLKTR